MASKVEAIPTDSRSQPQEESSSQRWLERVKGWWKENEGRIGPLVVLLIILITIFAVRWGLDPYIDPLWILAALIFVSVGIFPLTYYAYLEVRAPAKQARLKDDFRLLGLSAEAELDDVVNNLFQTVYSPAQFFVFYSLNIVLVLCMGIAFLLFIESPLVNWARVGNNLPIITIERLREAIGLGPLPSASYRFPINLALERGQISLIFSAFLGAYLFGIQELVRRYNTFDLLPQVYSSIFVRMIVATGIVGVAATLVNTAANTQSIALIVAFLIGVFPRRGLDWLTEKARNVFDTQHQNPSSIRPLTNLIGINMWHKARLEEMGIDDAQNLATVDIRKLLLTTQFDTQQIVNWIDQAILYVKVGDKIETLRSYHITTFSEFRAAFADLLQALPADGQNSANSDRMKTLEDLLKPDLGGASVIKSLADYGNCPNFAHIAEYYVRSRMVVQQRAAAGTEVIVGLLPYLTMVPYLTMDIHGYGMEDDANETTLQGYIKQISELLKNKPNDPQLRLALGVNKQRLSKHLSDEEARIALEEAQKAFEAAVALQPDYADAYVRWAAYRLERKEYAQAIRDCSHALRFNPTLAIAYNYRGLAQLALGYENLALSDFSKALELNDCLAEAYMNRGTLHNAQGNFAQAGDDFRGAYLSGLRTLNLFANWGKALIGQKKYEPGIAKLSEAIALDPSAAMPYADRGYAYLQRKEFQESYIDSQQAIRNDPKLTSAYVNSGLALFGQKQYKKAVEAYNKAKEIALASLDANTISLNTIDLFLARAQFFDQQYAEAIQNFVTVLTSKPDDLDEPETRLYLALAYREMKQLSKAKQQLEWIRDNTPKESEAYKKAERLLSELKA